MRAHPCAAGGAPEALRRGRSLANRNLTALPGKRCAPPCCSRPSRPGRNPTCREDQGQANELESLLLAVEVKPTQLKSPLVAPAGLHRTYVNDLFGFLDRGPARWGPPSAAGQPTTAVR